MKAFMQYVIFTIFMATYFVSAAGAPACAQTALEKKIDSLFVIASSAELKVRDQVEPAKEAIAAIGVDAVPILVDKLTTKDARDRWTVIQILKKIGSPAVPYLVRSLGTANGLVVQRVCWALGDIGDTSAVEPLIGVTTHGRWQVRDEALGALGDIGDARAVAAIEDGFSDPVGQVRKAAVVAAGKVGANELINHLVGMMDDDFYGARFSAADALLKLDTAAVIKAVSDSMPARSELIGHIGCWVLGQIGTDPALEILGRQTKTRNPIRRAHAAVALAWADPLDNCGYIKEFLARETDPDVLLKVNSAIYTATNARKEPEK